MAKNRVSISDNNTLPQVVKARCDIKEAEAQLMGALQLTEEDARRAEATASALVEQADLLNRILSAFNALPSGYTPHYQKTAPRIDAGRLR